jgi:hypothetical protein
LTSVSCATSTFCAAIGTNDVVTYNGTSWSKALFIDPNPPGISNEITSVSCPTTTFCAVVDEAGNVLTYNGTTWSKPTTVDSNHPAEMAAGNLDSPFTVTCTSATFCVAFDLDASTYTFNGRTWSEPATIDPLADAAKAMNLDSISCPVADFCMAIDSMGHALTGS